MGRPCSVCRHEDRHDIDAAIVRGGETIREIAQRHELTCSAVHRHLQNHVDRPADPTQLAAHEQTDSLRRFAWSVHRACRSDRMSDADALRDALADRVEAAGIGEAGKPVDWSALVELTIATAETFSSPSRFGPEGRQFLFRLSDELRIEREDKLAQAIEAGIQRRERARI